MKKVHLTFDYELFFGTHSGSVNNSIIKPTEMIMEVMKKHKATATFFVDYLMISKLQNASEKTKLEAQKISDQLCRLVKAGHRIELHIHPHWLDAKFIDGAWDFSDMRKYRLHSLSESEIMTLFIEGKNHLETIARGVSSDYTIRCFRAGGWCIQPFSRLKSAFQITGLIIDSSVSYGAVSNSKVLKFDYTNTPDKVMYRFADEVEVEDKNGEFLEIPISFYHHGLSHRIENQIDKKVYRSRYIKFGDGCHNGLGADNERRRKKIVFAEKRMLSIDGVKPRIILNALRKSDRNKFVIISHPKDITIRSLDVLEKLCASKEFELTSLQ